MACGLSRAGRRREGSHWIYARRCRSAIAPRWSIDGASRSGCSACPVTAPHPPPCFPAPNLIAPVTSQPLPWFGVVWGGLGRTGWFGVACDRTMPQPPQRAARYLRHNASALIHSESLLEQLCKRTCSVPQLACNDMCGLREEWNLYAPSTPECMSSRFAALALCLAPRVLHAPTPLLRPRALLMYAAPLHAAATFARQVLTGEGSGTTENGRRSRTARGKPHGDSCDGHTRRGRGGECATRTQRGMGNKHRTTTPATTSTTPSTPTANAATTPRGTLAAAAVRTH